MIGFKATDKDMKCRGYQYELGKWYKHEGELELCKSGFHFCKHPSGVWNYYNNEGTRVFKVECRDIIEIYEAGASLKLVCKEIMFLEEIAITGDSNTGYRNTGDRNTGDSNTGYRNTGDRNTGDNNTGNSNTGNRNTGDSNTGYRNIGDRNTGNSNTGYRNTGDSNTGDSNTGNRNTGYSNITNRSSGLFCQKEPNVIVFDEPTELTFEQFFNKYPNYLDLVYKLMENVIFDYTEFSNLPNWTLEKCKSLHEKFIASRKQKE